MTRYRRFVFTFNNPDQNGWEEVERNLSEKVGDEIRYMVWQTEVGDEGTPHVQGYIELRKRTRANTVNRDWFNAKAHTEIAFGKQKDCVHYCQKPKEGCKCKHCIKARLLPNGGIVIPWQELGEKAKQGLSHKLRDFEADILDPEISRVMLLERNRFCSAVYPRYEAKVLEVYSEEKAIKRYEEGGKPEVVVLWGETGSGKTKRVYDEVGPRKVHRPLISGGSRGSNWFNGYRMQPVLLLDDFYGQVPLQQMLRLTDRYPEPQQTKGGMITPCYEKIVITSNSHPDEWYRRAREKTIVAEQQWPALLRRFDKIEEVSKPLVRVGRERKERKLSEGTSGPYGTLNGMERVER